ncbi:zinc finger protein 84-like isoform X3 [Pleurodeles waltl]|uniref:zinc finger protein 84-like isoform X3 n=1 Tax=Pleurodeles waltl TaxID=8319 RepID=UPI003709AE05
MPRSGSEEVHIIFHDAPAYFSDEEWKLLHDWQKELYRNVMKEIHQALMSLGPLITTTISSLRAKEKQEQCSSGPKDLSARYIIPDSPTGGEVATPDVVRIKGEETADLNYSQDTQGRLRNLCHSKGLSIFKKVKRRKESVILIDDFEQEVAEGETDHTLDDFTANATFLPRLGSDEEVHIKEEDTGRFIIADSNLSPRLGNSDEVSLTETTLQRSGGDESTDKAKEDGDSVYCSETNPCSNLFRKRSSIKAQSSHKASDRSEAWAHRGENTTQFESGFISPSLLSAYQGRSNTGALSSYRECESNPRNSQFSSCLPNTNSQLTMYKFTECDEIGGTIDQLGGLMRTHLRGRPYACSECDKSFFEKSHLIAHQTTHLGERMYTCSFCTKSFNRKYSLLGHMRTHTGEKPYKCTECDKEFIWKSGFNRHQKTHTSNYTVQ